jgi:hypothetical protein
MFTKHTRIMKRAKKVPWTLPWNYEPAEENDNAVPTVTSTGVTHMLDEKEVGSFYRILDESINVIRNLFFLVLG